MTDLHPLWQVLIMAAVIAFTRFLPFLAFPEGRKRPQVITYLGSVLPYAIIGMLVVYCFKDVSVLQYPYGLPEMIAAAFVVGMHVWLRNTLVSVFGGVAVYMLLVQLVFK